MLPVAVAVTMGEELLKNRLFYSSGRRSAR